MDLNPSGFTTSVASGISGGQQVGYGSGPASGNNTHALLWSGTANSVVNLHSFLSSDFSFSVAEGIDANGNVVGFARYIPTGQDHAILWTAVPGPEHAIYKSVGQQTIYGNSKITRVTVQGYTVFEPDTGRGTSIGAFVLNKQKFFEVVPLQNYQVARVTGPNGTTYTILAKAESPGTQFAGTLLEAVYFSGRDSSVTLGAAGSRLMPRKLVSSGRSIVRNNQTGITAVGESSGRAVLVLKASIASNNANESFDSTVERLKNLFIARGYNQTHTAPVP